MKTVEIPGGQAQLREKADIKVRHRRLVEAAAMAAAPLLAKLPEDVATRQALTEAEVLALGVSRQEANAMLELQDATIIAALASWTLDQPVPDMDTVGDLDPELYDALSAATAALGAEITQETFDPPDPGSPGFEESPTVPSDGSGPDSEGTRESASTVESPSSGTSTSTAAPSPV